MCFKEEVDQVPHTRVAKQEALQKIVKAFFYYYYTYHVFLFEHFDIFFFLFFQKMCFKEKQSLQIIPENDETWYPKENKVSNCVAFDINKKTKMTKNMFIVHYFRILTTIATIQFHQTL